MLIKQLFTSRSSQANGLATVKPQDFQSSRGGGNMKYDSTDGTV